MEKIFKDFFKFVASPFTKVLIIGLLIFNITLQLSNGMVIPVKKIVEQTGECSTTKYLRVVGAPEDKIQELSKGVKIASDVTSLREELIIAIIKTESNFEMKAISSKNYKGLMQTPSASFIYYDVDILHGARILEDKLKYSKGNLLQALTLYKGGNNPVARRYAMETLNLYNKLISM